MKQLQWQYQWICRIVESMECFDLGHYNNLYHCFVQRMKSYVKYQIGINKMILIVWDACACLYLSINYQKKKYEWMFLRPQITLNEKPSPIDSVCGKRGRNSNACVRIDWLSSDSFFGIKQFKNKCQSPNEKI